MFNVSRPTTAPASLAQQKSYTEADVLNVLKEIFHDKCYLCETKNPNDINEHLLPHRQDSTLKFDWLNLFYACSRCNNIKLGAYDNILDCSNDDVDVFQSIKLLPPLTPNAELVRVEAVKTDVATCSTAELLHKIYNEPNTLNKQITAAYLRAKIYNVYNRFTQLMNEYFNHESSTLVKEQALEKMQTYMEKSQEYSAFLRWLVLEDKKLKPLLEPHMD